MVAARGNDNSMTCAEQVVFAFHIHTAGAFQQNVKLIFRMVVSLPVPFVLDGLRRVHAKLQAASGQLEMVFMGLIHSSPSFCS